MSTRSPFKSTAQPGRSCAADWASPTIRRGAVDRSAELFFQPLRSPELPLRPNPEAVRSASEAYKLLWLRCATQGEPCLGCGVLQPQRYHRSRSSHIHRAARISTDAGLCSRAKPGGADQRKVIGQNRALGACVSRDHCCLIDAKWAAPGAAL